ncbi:MAG TPA: lysophospholipid acyltransferase family protein [Micromonosporaceae bacterium]|nr:lysophospholipid acyltransferase family protein [Micromonosporaceae bacterium]
MTPLYRVGKLTVGSLMAYGFRPKVEGVDNVPTSGGAIIASNHLSVADQLFLGSVVRRQVHFWAKEEYFHMPGIKGKLLHELMDGLGTIPVHREGGRQALHALDAAVPVLKGGELVGIFPEGTRSPDGKLHRGRTGVARLAMEAGVPVVPLGIIGSDKVQPKGHTYPRPGALFNSGVIMRFGKPLDFSDRPDDMSTMRAITDEIMAEIQKLSGQEYTGRYAQRPSTKAEGKPAKPETAADA